MLCFVRALANLVPWTNGAEKSLRPCSRKKELDGIDLARCVPSEST